jgi:hypothetical protein
MLNDLDNCSVESVEIDCDLESLYVITRCRSYHQ